MGDDTSGDIDIFFTSGNAFAQTYKLLESPPTDEDAWALHGYTPVHTWEQVLTNTNLRYVQFKNVDPNRRDIQLIKMFWFEGPEHVIDSFDFTITQFAMTSSRFVFNPMALIDLHTKQIVLNRLQFPVTALRRLIKYAKKGFHAPPSLLLSVAEGIKEAVEIEDPKSQFYES